MSRGGSATESDAVGGLRLVFQTLSRSMVATVFLMGGVTGLLLLYVAAHARLAASEYEFKRLQSAQREETERHRKLTVDLDAATAPDRIRAEAERMGLVQYASTDIQRVRAVVPDGVETPESDAAPEAPSKPETAVALREPAPEGPSRAPDPDPAPLRALATGL